MESASHAGGDSTARSAVSAPTGDSVLLLSSPMERTDDDYLVGTADPVDTSNVVTVTLEETVDEVTDRYLRTAGQLPARLAVITVGDTTRTAAAASGGRSGDLPRSDGVSTAPVSSPADLTGLGIKLSQCLTSWADDDAPATVRFDSLTTLLQFADLKRVFRFLHVLTGRIDSAGAVGYFHVDPAAHDDQTLATLQSLFDSTYELGSDGTWTEY